MYFGKLEKHVFCIDMGKTLKSQFVQPSFLLIFFTNQLYYHYSITGQLKLEKTWSFEWQITNMVTNKIKSE